MAANSTDVGHPLVLGLVGGAGWDYVRGWVMTLRDSGYAGDAVLMTANCDETLSDECARWSVQTIDIDPAELATRHRTDPTNGRHGAIARFIEERYRGRFVLVCDTRDVVFQTDPFEFFRTSPKADPEKLHVISEEIVFGQEPPDGTPWAARWGLNKVETLFSARERAELRGAASYNIGILCGPAELVAGMERIVHLLCFNSTSQVTDQAAMNLVMQIEPWRSRVAGLGFADGWGVHLSPVKHRLVPPDVVPRIEDGVVKTADGRAFSVVHQYDRIRRLRKQVAERLERLESGDLATGAT